MRGLGLLATFALQVVLARELGAQEFGLYSFGFALLLLLLIPAKFGLDQSVFRFTSERLGLADPGGAHQYVRTAIVHALGVSTAIALLWCGVAFTGGLGELGSSSVDVVLLAACLPCLAIIRVTEGSLRATGHLVAAYAPFALCWPLAFLVTVVSAGGVMSMDLHSVLVVQLVAFAGVATWQIHAVYRALDRSQVRALSRVERRTWLRTSLNFALISGFALILGQSDIVLVHVMLGNTDAGIYAAAWRIASVVGAFSLAFNYSFGPVASRLYWEDRKAELQSYLTRAMSTIVALCCAVAVAIVVLGRPLLGLFGPEFESGYATLVILVAAQLANTIGGPVNLLLGVTGHERRAAVILGVAAFANVLLNVAFVAVLGIEGAAVGTCICTIAWNCAMVRSVSQRLGLTVFNPLGDASLTQASEARSRVRRLSRRGKSRPGRFAPDRCKRCR